MMQEDFLRLLLDKLDNLTSSISSLSSTPANPGGTMTYGEWLERWLTMFKAPKAKYNYYCSLRSYVRRDISPCLGTIPLVELSSMRLQQFLLTVPTDNTRTKLAAILSESIRKAYELRLIPFNVFLAVEYKKYQPPRLGALTHSQQLDFLHRASSYRDKRFELLSRLLLLTGLRQGEALALVPSDIDINRKILYVSKSVERVTNNLVTPKTKAGNRSVPLEDSLIESLKPYLKLRGRIFPYRPDTVSRQFRSLFHSIGTQFSGHILRHTFITNCYELDIPGYVVQRWVGHSKLAQADTYLSLRRSDDFIETEVVSYMLALKHRVVVNISLH